GDRCSGRVRHDPVRRRAERLTAADEPAEVRLGLTERRLVGEAPGERSPGACPLLLHECDVAAVLGFLPFELGEHRPRALALGGEQADEDLVAQWRRPSRTAGEPGGERPLAARREAKQAPQARAERLIASNHEAATLELVQQLIDLPVLKTGRVCPDKAAQNRPKRHGRLPARFLRGRGVTRSRLAELLATRP